MANTRMTREEFIDGYVKRSALKKYRTAQGYNHSGFVRLAMPCACGDDGCEGWQMVSKEIHDSWIKIAGPNYYETGCKDRQ